MVVAANKLDAGGMWRGLERTGKRLESWEKIKAQKPQPVNEATDTEEDPPPK